MYFRLTFKSFDGKTRTEWVEHIGHGSLVDRTHILPITYEVVDKRGEPKYQFVLVREQGPVAKVQKTYEDGTKDTTIIIRAEHVVKRVPATMDRKYAELEVA